MIAVIDTNVLLIANDQHEDVSPECIEECVQRLQTLQSRGIVVIDDGYRILGEYCQKTSTSPPKGVGDVFLKWLLRNVGNNRRVHVVPITEAATGDEFAEFPDSTLQAEFDPSDRKFAAVANAHPEKPPVWQGADSKWLNWWRRLEAYGVVVEFLCPADTCRFYRRKFPGLPVPSLPEGCRE